MDMLEKERKPHHLTEELEKLAYNLWWTWNPEAQEIFKILSPSVWESSCHNPVAVLNSVSQQELEARLFDPDLKGKVEEVIDELRAYLNSQQTWVQQRNIEFSNPIAYFSAEFGLHESLRIYSGGLGILSGDYAKSASDLGIPFIGISLFYREGYFEQKLDPKGWQHEKYVPHEENNLPMRLVLERDHKPLLNSVEIGHTSVFFQTWKVEVGRISIYLLDTNVPENDQHFQLLTAHVYGGDVDTRIGQEIILGIGGIRLLRSLKIYPGVYHMNEGHSAFLTLELLREELAKETLFADAHKSVKDRCVFTTHTPVPAGHDRFSSEIMEYALGKFWNSTGLTNDDLMALGRINENDQSESFTMTVLSFKMSRAANGVSDLHGQISREMWRDLFSIQESKDVPIGHITNGIHTPSWATQRTHEFWNKRLGFDWTDKLMDPSYWIRFEADGIATDEELWAYRYTLRRELVEFSREQLRRKYHHTDEEEILLFDKILSPDALTICFARRFATYKRAPLFFRYLEKITPLFEDQDRPIQIIFSGKAHPRDHDGKKFIQHIIELTHQPQLFGKVIFLENYNINVGRMLVSGADVWLNTPRRPLEASGTSGMKITIHGGLNLSILDGWWREGYNGKNGWAIGDDDHIEDDLDSQDEKDFTALYRVLTEEVIPEFYDRNKMGIPRKWISRIRNAMRTLLSEYSTDRMVGEYVTKYYMK